MPDHSTGSFVLALSLFICVWHSEQLLHVKESRDSPLSVHPILRVKFDFLDTQPAFFNPCLKHFDFRISVSLLLCHISFYHGLGILPALYE
jgi:hypothetical protein